MTTTRSMMGITDIPKSKSEARRINIQKEGAEKHGNVVFVYTTTEDDIEYKEVPKIINSVDDLIKKLESLNVSEGTFRIKDNKIYIS
jgi:hypothetical protein